MQNKYIVVKREDAQQYLLCGGPHKGYYVDLLFM